MRGHVVSECSALQNLDHSEVIRKLIKQNNFFEPSEINIGVGNLGKYTSEKTFFLEYDPDFKQEKYSYSSSKQKIIPQLLRMVTRQTKIFLMTKKSIFHSCLQSINMKTFSLRAVLFN